MIATMRHQRLRDFPRSSARESGGGMRRAISSPTALSLAVRLVVTRGWTIAAGYHAVGVTPRSVGPLAAFSASIGPTPPVNSITTTATRTRLPGWGSCYTDNESNAGWRGSRRPRWSNLDSTRRCFEGSGDNAGTPSIRGHATTRTTTSLHGHHAALGTCSQGVSGTKLVRLSKVLADRAVGSRTEVDAMIRQGRIKVDGSVIKSPKKKLPADCVIEVNGQSCGPLPLLVAFHKPKGVITTVSDEWSREDLSHALPKSLLRKHHPVGRLDADSSGLLLLSSDGTLTHRLLNPRFEVEREYVATVDVSQSREEPGEALVAALKQGVQTADGVYEGDVREIEGRCVRLVVREGKNRMVRRMLANAGYPVLELRRVRYGEIFLGDLAEGQHESVTGDALGWARSILDGVSASGSRQQAV